MSEAVKRASFAVEDMRQGGGNLWGSAGPVRAQITGGKFTKEAPDNYNAQGNPIFANVNFELLGDQPVEERTVSQSYSLGAQAGDNFTISDDGDYLIPTTNDAAIVKDSKFGLFASSLQNEGVNKAILQSFSFSQIVGLDGDFKRIADKARDFADKKTDGKKFPPSTLLLVKLHGIGKQTGTAAATKTTSTPTTTNGALEDADVWPYLETALKDGGGSVQRGRLVLAVSKAASKHANRQGIARRASEETFINEMVSAGLVAYASAERGQPVSLVQ